MRWHKELNLSFSLHINNKLCFAFHHVILAHAASRWHWVEGAPALLIVGLKEHLLGGMAPPRAARAALNLEPGFGQGLATGAEVDASGIVNDMDRN